VDNVALDSGEVDGLLEGLDNTVITGSQLGTVEVQGMELTPEEVRI
jgi:hypothetical protein